MHEVQFSEKSMIFNQGEPSDCCFRILSGQVEIHLARRGLMNRNETTVLATFGPGEIIGEMGAIAGGTRSASAIATQPTICQRLSPDEIVERLENNPQEAMSYVRTLIRRIRTSNKSLSLDARLSG